MHIPDGFLDTKTIVATTIFSIIGFGTALHKLKNTILPSQIPLIGLTAAFVFVAQMLNFPVIVGTSGHLVGSVLTAVLLGPNAAVVVITSVLVVQCFLFADGGVLALGANTFNMAIVGSFVGYAIFRGTSKFIRGRRGWFTAIFFASWCITVLSSVLCSGELAWSGVVQWNAAFPVMANVHMLVGIVEGLITVLIVAAVWKARPDLLQEQISRRPSFNIREIIIYGIIIILGLLLFVSPFVSKLPDGLETILSTVGFDQKVIDSSLIQSPISNYKFQSIESPVVATMLAGVVGAVCAFIVGLVVSKFLVSQSDKNLSLK